jgi:hypothetical protein
VYSELMCPLSLSFIALIHSPGSSYPLEPALVYLTSTASNFSPEACLQLTSRLLQEAQICARNEAPAVYSIAQLLLDRPDEMIEILKSEWHYVSVNSLGLLSSDWTSRVRFAAGKFCAVHRSPDFQAHLDMGFGGTVLEYEDDHCCLV